MAPVLRTSDRFTSIPICNSFSHLKGNERDASAAKGQVKNDLFKYHTKNNNSIVSLSSLQRLLLWHVTGNGIVETVLRSSIFVAQKYQAGLEYQDEPNQRHEQ